MKEKHFHSKKKHMLRKINVILLIISFMFTFIDTTTVYAEEKEKELMTLKRQMNIVINIKYDTEVPIISFVAPDGTVYKEGQTPKDKMVVEHSDKIIYYKIPNAQAGKWKLRYDKLSNKNLNIDAVEYADAITIDSFTASNLNVDNSQIDVKFLVNHKQTSSYNYEISAILLDENKHETANTLLSTGTATTNEEKTLTVPLSNLATNDKYYLKLYVYKDDNSMEVFNYAYTKDSITYVNKNTPKAQGNINTELELTEGLLSLDWSKDFGGKKCSIVVYDSSDTEPIYTNEFESENQSTQISVDPNATSVKIELKYEENGLYSEPIIKEIKLNDKSTFNINIATEEMTNSHQAKVEYKNAKKQKINIEINGETTEKVIDGDGDFSINLNEFSNVLKIGYSTDEYTKIIIGKEIVSDRVAPNLKLYENKSDITVNSSKYTITGEIELDCTLTIANKTVKVGDDGTFSYEVKLKNGKNTFDIVVTDKAGNKTAHTLSINRGNVAGGNSTNNIFDKLFGGSSDYWLMIVSFVVSILVVISILFVKLRKPKFKNIFLVISGLSAASTIFMYAKRVIISRTINTAKYFDVAKESVENASKLLGQYDFYKTASRYSLLVNIILIVIIIVWILMSKKKKKKTEE